MNRIKRLINRCKEPLLYLRFPDRPPVEIYSVEEFDFACEGRHELPHHRIAEISQMSTDQIQETMDLLSRQNDQLSSILVGYTQDAEKARPHFNGLLMSSFSKDHGWRDMLQSLRDVEGGKLVDQCRISLLRHYQRYLINRRDVLNDILLSRKGSMDPSLDNKVKEQDSLLPSSKDRAPEPLGHFTQELPEAKRIGNWEYERLPRGQSITLTIQPGEDMDILISRHKCKIIIDDKELKFLRNDSEEPVTIRPGRTAIGRDTVNDIVLDSAWRDVSRLHIVLDHQGDQLHITDMSSYGTFLPIHLIARHKDTLH